MSINTEVPTFDIAVGMLVFGPNGQEIGSVTEIAGFGSTRFSRSDGAGTDEVITQASSGTGYFKVARTDVRDVGDGGMYVPFHGIQEIKPGHGVTISGAVVSELREQAEVPGAQSTPTEKSSSWRRWRPGGRKA